MSESLNLEHARIIHSSALMSQKTILDMSDDEDISCHSLGRDREQLTTS